MKIKVLFLLFVVAIFPLQPTKAQEIIILDPLPNLIQPAPIQRGPVYTEPIYSSPIYVAPIHSEPIQPIYSEPIQTAPIQTGPIETPPIQRSPIYKTPIYITPIHITPIHITPIQTGPVELTPSQPQPTPTAESFTGRVVFNNFEGGFYGIVSDTGKQYTGVIPDAYKKDGMRVKGKLEPSSNQVSTRMWGTIVDFIEILPQ